MAFVYSFCFWFSLRLGGIIIGCVTLVQILAIITCLTIGYLNPSEVTERVIALDGSYMFLYGKQIAHDVADDPRAWLGNAIIVLTFNGFSCALLIYGAYALNAILLYIYIILEFVRLIGEAFICVWLLMVIKANSLDIGLLIGMSVAAVFTMLGLIYLWVCVVSLVQVMKELEKDDVETTVTNLSNLVNEQRNLNRRRYLDEAYDEDTNPLSNSFYRNQGGRTMNLQSFPTTGTGSVPGLPILRRY